MNPTDWAVALREAADEFLDVPHAGRLTVERGFDLPLVGTVWQVCDQQSVLFWGSEQVCREYARRVETTDRHFGRSS